MTNDVIFTVDDLIHHRSPSVVTFVSLDHQRVSVVGSIQMYVPLNVTLKRVEGCSVVFCELPLCVGAYY